MAARQIGRARLGWMGWDGMGSGGLVFRRGNGKTASAAAAGRRNAGSRVEVMRVMEGMGLARVGRQEVNGGLV
jgi:hypothetical protein